MNSTQKKLLMMALLGVLAPNMSAPSISSPSDQSSTTPPENGCTLPKEFPDLPSYAQKELKTIWDAYKLGADCTQEKEKTADILAIVKQFGEEFGPEKTESTEEAEETTTSEPSTEAPEPQPSAVDVEPSTASFSTTELDFEDFEATPEAKKTTSQSEYPTMPPLQRLRADRPRLRGYPRRPPQQRRPQSFGNYDYAYQEELGYTNPPTQGKIPKAPNDYDYLEPKMKAEFRRYEQWKKQQNNDGINRDESRGANTEIGARMIYAKPQKFNEEYRDYDENDSGFRKKSDYFGTKFDMPSAPFLSDVSPGVRRAFMSVWKDEDIASDSLKADKIQLLAVSLLTGSQLQKYNAWATQRRRALKLREQEISELSPAAKRILRKISNSSDTRNLRIHPQIKQELRDFIDRHRRRIAARSTKY